MFLAMQVVKFLSVFSHQTLLAVSPEVLYQNVTIERCRAELLQSNRLLFPKELLQHSHDKLTLRHGISYKSDGNDQLLIFISVERGDQASYIM